MSARTAVIGAAGLTIAAVFYLWVTRGAAILLDMSWFNNCF
ncbi:MAG: hypothetical protein ACYC1L_07110 [Alphaproteobacteria bacterium]